MQYPPVLHSPRCNFYNVQSFLYLEFENLGTWNTILARSQIKIKVLLFGWLVGWGVGWGIQFFIDSGKIIQIILVPISILFYLALIKLFPVLLCLKILPSFLKFNETILFLQLSKCFSLRKLDYWIVSSRHISHLCKLILWCWYEFYMLSESINSLNQFYCTQGSDSACCYVDNVHRWFHWSEWTYTSFEPVY